MKSKLLKALHPNPVKRLNPLPWAARPSGVAQANRQVAMSCRQRHATHAQKCCNACVTTVQDRVTGVEAAAGTVVVDVAARAAVVETTVATAVVVVQACAAMRNQQTTPGAASVHVPHRTVAAPAAGTVDKHPAPPKVASLIRCALAWT